MIRKALLALLFMAPAGLMAAPFGPTAATQVAQRSKNVIGPAGHIVGLLTEPRRGVTTAADEPTPEPSPSDSASPDPSVSPDPSDSPSPDPTDSPTPDPSDSPVPDPSVSPEPSHSPTPEPTPNKPPAAESDSYATDQGTTLSVPTPGVLGNDTDADNDALTAAVTDGPSHGSLALKSDGSFTYTPSSAYTGNDIFHYKTSDGTDTSDPATVTIAVKSRCPDGGCTKNFTCNGGGCYASSGCNAGDCNIHFTCDGGGCSFTAGCAGGHCTISSSCGGGGCSFKSTCGGGGCDITSSCNGGGCSARSSCDGGGCSFTSSCQGGGCSNRSTCAGGDCETDVTCNGGGCSSSGGRDFEVSW